MPVATDEYRRLKSLICAMRTCLGIPMPATFDPDDLRASLLPLAKGQPLSEQAQAYQRFYGLDFPQYPLRKGLGRFEIDGYEVVAQVWWPEKAVATMFVFHGYYDHMGLYRHLIEWALGQKFAVIACDLPGHGLSSGERASIQDFAEYQATLQGLLAEAGTLELPQPWHLCGQSTGGAQPRYTEPGTGPGNPAVAAGASPSLGLVAAELLLAQTFRERHRPSLQREFH
jgi:alpha-beta hydrolase superfamily lysophospholipase